MIKKDYDIKVVGNWSTGIIMLNGLTLFSVSCHNMYILPFLAWI